MDHRIVEKDWAGLGLIGFPLMYTQLDHAPENWMMSPAEQMMVIGLLDNLRPQVAIEIGTASGGCLGVISQFAKKAYSIDVDPEVAKRLAGRFPNVEFITGPSTDMLPILLDRIAKEQQPLSFVLVDGDHSGPGVFADVNAILRYKPINPMYVLMHDSMNPGVRKALLSIDWESSPHVHTVELDLVCGVLTPVPRLWGQAWEGLALAVMSPEQRIAPLVVTKRYDLIARYARRHRTLPYRIVNKLANFTGDD